MGLKNIIGAAIFAGLAPAMAAAVPLDISDNIDDDLRRSYSIYSGDTAFFYNERVLPEESDGTEKALFSFTNATGRAIKLIAGLDASVNPTASQDPAPTFFWGTNEPTWLDDSTIESGKINIGQSVDFSVFFGEVVDPDFSQVDVAFRVAPVPVPAGLVLLGTALGGFGFARRFRKS